MLTPTLIKKIEKISDPLAKQRYLKYFQLPQNIQEIFFTVETADKVREVSLINKLTDIQIWHFSYIVGLILLGELHIAEFVKTIQKDCGLAEEAARQLARDINQEVFLPLKDSLKKVHNVPDWPRERENGSQESSQEPELNGNVVNLKNQ